MTDDTPVRLENVRAQPAGRDWLAEAHDALERGDDTHAISAAQEALQHDPGLAEAWSIRSRASFGLRDYQGAAFAAREAVRLAPTTAQHHIDLGGALEVLERYDEALLELQQAVRLEPQNLTAQGAVGSVHLSADQPATAIPIFEGLMKKDPEEDMYRLFLARALAEDGEARMTSVGSSGAFLVTSAEQASIARNRATRGLGLKYVDEDGVRDQLEQLRRLGEHADKASWRMGRQWSTYGFAGLIAFVVALLGLATVQTAVVGVLFLAIFAAIVWVFVKRHRKLNWQWAAADLRRGRL